MEDTISRQAAIDAIEERVKANGYSNVAMISELNRLEGYIMQLPSAQPERPEQPESAREYCAECDHIEMCRWYPFEGCEFRSLPSAQRKGKWMETDAAPQADMREENDGANN